MKVEINQINKIKTSVGLKLQKVVVLTHLTSQKECKALEGLKIDFDET